MTIRTDPSRYVEPSRTAYALDEQIGFLLRRAHQRHISIFNEHMRNGLTIQQFAVLACLLESGRLSQNKLGRRTAMDQSTINGVVQRLVKRDYLSKQNSDDDMRKILVDLTDTGRSAVEEMINAANEITHETLAPLKPQQQQTLLKLLKEIS